jgi:hypothetical protein
MMEEYFRNGKAHVRSETFAVVKAKAAMPGAFAVIHDPVEITVVIDQSRVQDECVTSIDMGWRMLTFDMVLPLDLVGFLARVSQALAEENIGIFALSAYSTDHILVKEKHLAEAISVLRQLGLSVEDR